MISIPTETLGRFSAVPQDSQSGRVVFEIVGEICRVSVNDEEATERAVRAIELLEEIQDILNPLASSDTFYANKDEREEQKTALRKKLYDSELKVPQETRLWHYPVASYGAIEKDDNRDSWYVNRNWLTQICAEYVSKSWMQSETLDRILVHAYVYAETLGTDLAVRPALVGMSTTDAIFHPLKPGEFETRKSRRQWAILFWLCFYMFLSIAIGVAAWLDSGRWWVGAAVGLALLYLQEILGNFRLKEVNSVQTKLDDLLGGMRAVSKQIAESPISLLFLRERLAQLEEKGARWDGAVFAILDKAIQRGQITW